MIERIAAVIWSLSCFNTTPKAWFSRFKMSKPEKTVLEPLGLSHDNTNCLATQREVNSPSAMTNNLLQYLQLCLSTQ